VGQEASGFLSLSLLLFRIYKCIYIPTHTLSLALVSHAGWPRWVAAWGEEEKKKRSRHDPTPSQSTGTLFLFFLFGMVFRVCLFLFFPSHLLQILPFHRQIFVRVEIYSFSFFFLVVVANRKKNEGFSYGKCDVTFVRDTACNAPV
jgi:hypothetical protein